MTLFNTLGFPFSGLGGFQAPAQQASIIQSLCDQERLLRAMYARHEAIMPAGQTPAEEAEIVDLVCQPDGTFAPAAVRPLAMILDAGEIR